MKLNKEQLVLLNDVFNYALNLLESENFKDKKAINFSENGEKISITDWNEEYKKIEKLAEIMKPQIEVVEE